MNANKKQDIIEIFVKKMINVKLCDDEEKLYNNLDKEEKKIILELIKSESFLYEIVNLIEKIVYEDKNNLNDENDNFLNKNR